MKVLPYRARWIFTAANLVAVAILVYAISASLGEMTPRQVAYSEFLAEVRAGRIAHHHTRRHNEISQHLQIPRRMACGRVSNF
jgi:hypothetical protein